MRLNQAAQMLARHSWMSIPNSKKGIICPTFGQPPISSLKELLALYLSSICIDSLDRPHSGDISDPHRLRDLRAVHEPDRDIAAGVTPENIAPAVAVEIAGF